MTFFRRRRLKKYFYWKDSSSDVGDKALTFLQDLENHKLYRPKSSWEPDPCKLRGAIESHIKAVESDIEILLFKQHRHQDI